ncbi:MAG: helix-turn-helix domain-containing protein [Pseudomonadota bacterium]
MLPINADTNEKRDSCPIRNVLANLNGKWQPLILLALEDGPQRFNQLKRLIGDITQRVLTETLRTLERDGYITRTVQPTSPVRVDYELTDLGQALLSVMKPMVFWANDAYPAVRTARATYDAARA